ncbi:MAG TPA: GxxExxY protein [Gemmatimonadales bacterium]|jgi:GxxExxY protein|nr:GxxExxY protein [Gemmatimonadales bacterium]
MGLIEHPTNPTSDKVIGAAIEVHRQLGPGLLESSYHTCLCRELELRQIPHQSEVALPLEYKGARISKGYVIDLVIEHSLIVEIKSVEKLLPIHSSQLMTYMRLQNVPSGLLINFNVHALFQGLKRMLR